MSKGIIIALGLQSLPKFYKVEFLGWKIFFNLVGQFYLYESQCINFMWYLSNNIFYISTNAL